MRLEINLPNLPAVPPEWLTPAAWAAGGTTAYLLAGSVAAGLCYRWRHRDWSRLRLGTALFGSGEDVANALLWPVLVLANANLWLLPALRVLLHVPSRPFVWAARAAAGRD